MPGLGLSLSCFGLGFPYENHSHKQTIWGMSAVDQYRARCGGEIETKAPKDFTT